MTDDLPVILRKFEESAITTLEHVRGKEFRNETVEIDGKRFTSCSFDGCRLKYSGGDVEFGIGCNLENSRPIFFGSARRTRASSSCARTSCLQSA